MKRSGVVILLSASACLLWLWAQRVPGTTVGAAVMAVVAIVAAGGVIFVPWARRSRRTLALECAVVMVAACAGVALASSGVAREVAFAVSRNSLETRAVQQLAGGEASELPGAWFGVYNVDEIECRNGCVWFRFRDAGVLFRHGLAYSPAGPPPPQSDFHREYTAQSPGWYFWNFNVD